MPETGGILLGSLRGPHLEVVDFTTAGKEDLEYPFDFIRQDPCHQDRALRAWATSDQTVTFIGEWHTHPIGSPSPSSIDLKTWRSLVKRRKQSMVFIIVSPQAWRVHLLAYNAFRLNPKPFSKTQDGVEGQVFE
jgi:integrative and conjugative element protein (TIGR02256 family)